MTIAASSSARQSVLVRVRTFVVDSRTASGLIAGALLGYLVKELGIWPIKGVLVFALVGALITRFRLAARALYLADVAMLVLAGIVATTPVMSVLAGRWIRADSLPASDLDAVVVLSSSVTSGHTLNQTAADRLITGLELVRRGVAPRLVTTRVTQRSLGTVLTSDADQARLIGLVGLTPRWMLVGDEVHSTRDEAAAIARRMRPLGAQRMAIVTSPMHTRRACATFETVGFRVTCVAALERAAQTRRPSTALDRLAAFRAYTYERLGWLLYRYRGWVT